MSENSALNSLHDMVFLIADPIERRIALEGYIVGIRKWLLPSAGLKSGKALKAIREEIRAAEREIKRLPPLPPGIRNLQSYQNN